VEFRKNFYKINATCPPCKTGIKLKLDSKHFYLMQLIAGQPLADIYRLVQIGNDDDGESELQFCSLKVCKELNYWEFYIYDELERRLFKAETDIVSTTCCCFAVISISLCISLQKSSVMTVDKMVFYNNGSLVFTDVDMGW